MAKSNQAPAASPLGEDKPKAAAPKPTAETLTMFGPGRIKLGVLAVEPGIDIGRVRQHISRGGVRVESE